MRVNHSGHRQRLKKALRENGLLSFSPHEVIELMLYTALPRRDVNELAHEIDDSLGGVCGLINTDTDRLLSLGLSKKTADTLKAYSACVKAYTASLKDDPENKIGPVLNRGDLERLVRNLFEPGKRILALLSPGWEVIYKGEEESNKDIARFVAEKALSYDASAALLI